jgi:hypothetical protein
MPLRTYKTHNAGVRVKGIGEPEGGKRLGINTRRIIAHYGILLKTQGGNKPMNDITVGTTAQSTNCQGLLTPSAPNSAASKYFKREDFSCRCGCGVNNVSAELVAVLDRIRELANIPLRITSGSRCKKHNGAVGGNADSAHLKGLAADIAINGSHERYLAAKSAIIAGVERLGIGSGLIHLDIDKDKPAQVIWLYA